MTKQKIDTLLNSIKCDLFYLQEKIELNPYQNPTPAYDAFEIVERHTKNAVTFIDQFTPSKERTKKYKHVVSELINLDKQKILTDQVGNYD
jgi:hypothetical protein